VDKPAPIRARHSLRAKIVVACVGILVPAGVAGVVLWGAARGGGDHEAGLILLGALLAATAGAGLWANLGLWRRIGAALTHLRTSTRAFRCDEVPPQYELNGRDELSRLSQELAAMAQGTLSTQQEAVAHRQTLESEIRARTIELQQKNLALAYQNEKVIEANRLKSAFLANVSHELRTPLNAILALSDMLHDEVAGPLKEEQLKQVELITNSGENLLHLINEVLDLSKLDSGRMKESREPVTIIDLLTECAQNLRPLADEKGLTLTIDADGAGEEVEVDGEKIRQVFLNLLGNAIKFTDGGSITARLRLLKEEDLLCVEVQDTGPGVPAHLPHAIFEEFRRLEQADGVPLEGSGLGLAIGKKLVSLMGGDLWVDSMPGAGSRFSFVIPLRTESAQAREIRDRNRRAGRASDGAFAAGDGRKRVLLVDNDIVESGVLARHLRRRELDIFTAHDMHEAMQVLGREEIDLLLMDLLSQGDEGFRLIENIMRDPALGDLPILVNSARTFTQEENAFLETRVGGVFEKGSRGVDDLLSLVSSTVAQAGEDLSAPQGQSAEDAREAA